MTKCLFKPQAITTLRDFATAWFIGRVALCSQRPHAPRRTRRRHTRRREDTKTFSNPNQSPCFVTSRLPGLLDPSPVFTTPSRTTKHTKTTTREGAELRELLCKNKITSFVGSRLRGVSDHRGRRGCAPRRAEAIKHSKAPKTRRDTGPSF